MNAGIYNLMMEPHEIARQQSAGAFLYDELIKEFSHSGMMLDFEGSDIPGIEFFYKGFGAVNQPYFKTHINNLIFLYDCLSVNLSSKILSAIIISTGR